MARSEPSASSSPSAWIRPEYPSKVPRSTQIAPEYPMITSDRTHIRVCSGYELGMSWVRSGWVDGLGRLEVDLVKSGQRGSRLKRAWPYLVASDGHSAPLSPLVAPRGESVCFAWPEPLRTAPRASCFRSPIGGWQDPMSTARATGLVGPTQHPGARGGARSG